MDFKAHLKTAWEHTLQFVVPVILLTLVQLVVITLSFGILAPVTSASYMQSLLLAMREGREPKIGDLFSEMRLFLPLLVFGVLAMLAISLGFILLIVPGFLVTGFLVFATIYMMPLMTDRGMGLVDALKESWSMAVKKPLTDQMVLMALYLLILSVGGSIPIALLFAQPLATFFVLSVYRERLQGGQAAIEQDSAPQPPPLSSDHEA
ncbi:MAG: hypothetical protein U9R57_09640 [Thermodesulfobacteriota bacterium]|nr:hypothetical protein [Thermodesulfobacteriota bacterium]